MKEELTAKFKKLVKEYSKAIRAYDDAPSGVYHHYMGEVDVNVELRDCKSQLYRKQDELEKELQQVLEELSECKEYPQHPVAKDFRWGRVNFVGRMGKYDVYETNKKNIIIRSGKRVDDRRSYSKKDLQFGYDIVSFLMENLWSNAMIYNAKKKGDKL
jgi:hypothetical protein